MFLLCFRRSCCIWFVNLLGIGWGCLCEVCLHVRSYHLRQFHHSVLSVYFLKGYGLGFFIRLIYGIVRLSFIGLHTLFLMFS